jgi:hypothetical protein
MSEHSFLLSSFDLAGQDGSFNFLQNCIFVFILIFHCKNHTRTLELEIESGSSEAQRFDLQVDLLLELADINLSCWRSSKQS